MAATFTRVNGVLVDTSKASIDTGRYLDPAFQAPGSYSANIAFPLQTVASASLMYRGQGCAISLATGMLVPPSAPNSIPAGVLLDDITPYVAAKGTKVTFITRGKVRTYAGAALTIGQAVTMDTSASFCGFVPWASTMSPNLIHGHAFPLDDGSAENGASAASTMAQGDNIFVSLLMGA
jgi:hypothetical protein